MGSNGSIGVHNRGPKKGSKILTNSIGWPLNPGLLGLVSFNLKPASHYITNFEKFKVGHLPLIYIIIYLSILHLKPNNVQMQNKYKLIVNCTKK